MCLSSGRASAFLKTRLNIVTFHIKPKFQFIHLNSLQQNYAAATTNKYESRTKCYSIKNTPCKDLIKQDSLVKSCDFHLSSEPKKPHLDRSKNTALSSSNLRNNSQIYSTSRSFSLRSTLPSSPKRSSSTDVEPQAPPSSNEVKPQAPPSMDFKPSKTERLQMAFTEYGPTIMALHLAISLISFSGFYALLSGGIDVAPLLKFLGVSSSAMAEKIPTGSTFVVALAVHKILAPIRIAISLGVTPFVVRYMRTKGLMKAKTKTL